MSAFDPYQAWLGIEPREQPADWYRLLGLPRFEADAARIARAADERMALVRSYQMGPRGAFTQRLLNELAAARVCLLDARHKAAYDAGLAGRSLLQAPPPVAPPRLPPPAPEAIVEPPAQAGESSPPLDPRSVLEWRPLAVAAVALLAFLLAAIAWTQLKLRPSASPKPGRAPVAEDSAPPSAPLPIVVLQEGSGEVFFSAGAAALGGSVERRVVGTEEVLTTWSGPEDSATWHFRLVTPGFFRAELTYAATAEAEDAELQLAIDEQSKTCPLRPSGGLEQFHSDSLTLAVSSSGEHTLVLRPVREVTGEWLIVKQVRLVPVGTEKMPGPPSP